MHQRSNAFLLPIKMHSRSAVSRGVYWPPSQLSAVLSGIAQARMVPVVQCAAAAVPAAAPPAGSYDDMLSEPWIAPHAAAQSGYFCMLCNRDATEGHFAGGLHIRRSSAQSDPMSWTKDWYAVPAASAPVQGDDAAVATIAGQPHHVPTLHERMKGLENFTCMFWEWFQSNWAPSQQEPQNDSQAHPGPCIRVMSPRAKTQVAPRAKPQAAPRTHPVPRIRSSAARAKSQAAPGSGRPR